MTAEEKVSSFHPKAIIFASFFCLFLYGFIDNLKGVTLPELLSDFNINYSIGGVIQQGAYFGFLVSALATGYLLQRLKHQEVLLIAGLCLAVGISIYSSTRNSLILLIAMITIGLGLGFLDLVGIRLLTDYFKNQTGKLLNLSAFFHGLASMTAPLFGGYVIASNLSWNNAYQLSLILVGVFFLMLVLLRLPNEAKSSTQQIDLREQISRALRDQKARSYYMLIISYESIEIGLAVWLNEYLLSSANLSSALGVSYLSLFFLFLTIGRLVGSLIIERVGYLRLILYASIGVLFCLVLGLFGGTSLVFFLPLSGLFLSVIFPTTTAAASQDVEDNIDMSLSLFLTFAGLGGMIGSWAIGMIANYVGIRLGISFLILMSLSITIFTLVIIKLRQRTQNTPHL